MRYLTFGDCTVPAWLSASGQIALDRISSTTVATAHVAKYCRMTKSTDLPRSSMPLDRRCGQPDGWIGIDEDLLVQLCPE